MLRESQQDITEQSQWRKVKGSFDHDPRYRAVETSSKREELFQEFLQSLKDKEQVCCGLLPYLALKGLVPPSPMSSGGGPRAGEAGEDPSQPEGEGEGGADEPLSSGEGVGEGEGPVEEE